MITFWVDLSVSSETANQQAVKPFSKGKKEKDPFGKIDEFNTDLWGLKMDQWIIGTIGKGFDSMGIMQPLIDITSNSNMKASRTHSRLEVTGSGIGPSSQSRCDIVKGIIHPRN